LRVVALRRQASSIVAGSIGKALNGCRDTPDRRNRSRSRGQRRGDDFHAYTDGLAILQPPQLLVFTGVGHNFENGELLTPRDDLPVHQGSEFVTISGLKTSLSGYGPSETLNRILAAIEQLGMTVLARVDHSAAAAKVGMELRPTEVVLFGNPGAGTPLMQDAQAMGIDLPLKILVWQDDQNRTWVAFNDPFWLAGRHGVAEGAAPILDKMAKALAKIVDATSPSSTG
jgi:uncharacterized protein (DUF302 family)